MDSETSSSSPSENCEDEAGEDVTFPSTPSLGRVQTRVQVDVDSPEPSTDEPSTVSPAPSSASPLNEKNFAVDFARRWNFVRVAPLEAGSPLASLSPFELVFALLMFASLFFGFIITLGGFLEVSQACSF